VAFLESRLFSSQSELFENFLDCSDLLDKSRPSKNATFVLIMLLVLSSARQYSIGGFRAPCSPLATPLGLGAICHYIAILQHLPYRIDKGIRKARTRKGVQE